MFFEKTLTEVFEKKESYGSSNQLAGQRYVVEFSSPNIAKPFHAGHLRSTVIGNFLKNLYTYLGANTTSINYLGDWGTQYGILAVGFNRFGDEQKLQEEPIRHLFDVYVAANKLIEESPEVRDEAREIFKKMEDGDPEALALWKKFRDLSILEYKKVYKRLNVDFDVYSGESLQNKGMEDALKTLEEKKLLTQDQSGAMVIDLKKHKLNVSVVKKSDGTTLYITRDIAAAKSRWDEYSFDKSIYVVNAQQDLHFQQLFKILDMMDYEWAKKCVHVNFGMVLGMSTRKGTVVFLEDILEEAKNVMLEKMKEDKMGKLSEIEDPEASADIIGLSAIVIQDFSARRIRDYNFDWSRMTNMEGHTGPYLQYAHARLCSMEDKTTDVPLDGSANFDLLVEPQALALAQQISRFSLVLETCSQNMEPSTLVTYLFELAHAISTAHNCLRVKDQEINLSKARKLLFWSARVVLSNSMKILGLTPLTRM